MKINATEFNKNRHHDWNQIVKWIGDNISPITIADNKTCQGRTWRLYNTENSVEGFWESTYWLEFDNDPDATAFTLRWS